MERRVLIAVLLSFLVLYGYQLMFPAPKEPDQKPVQASKTATAPNASTPAPANPTPSVQAATPPAESTEPPASEVVVENADVRGVFTTRGAAVAAKLATAPFTIKSQGDTGGTWRAQFEYDDGAGLHAQKTFSIAAVRPYVVNVSASVTRDGQAMPVTIKWGPALGSGIVIKSRTYNPPPQPVFYRDGKVTRVAPDKVPAQPVQEGTFGFAGVDDHYFLVAVVKPAAPIRLDYAPLTVPVDVVPE